MERTYITPQQFIDENFGAKVPDKYQVFTSNSLASIFGVTYSKKLGKYVAHHALFDTVLEDGDVLLVEEWDDTPIAPAAAPPINVANLDLLAKIANLEKQVEAGNKFAKKIEWWTRKYPSTSYEVKAVEQYRRAIARLNKIGK